MRARRAGAGGRRALVRRRHRIVAFDTQILDPAFSPSRAARYVAEGAGGRPRVTYLAPHLPRLRPTLWAKLLGLLEAANATIPVPADPNGGFGDDGGDACDDDGDGGARDGAGAGAGARLAPRTIELLEYDAAPSGGSRGHAALGWHTDSGSLLTLLALLSPRDDFDGGELRHRKRCDESAVGAALGRGDVVVYRSLTPHRVTPVTRGRRVALAVEMWAFGAETANATRRAAPPLAWADSSSADVLRSQLADARAALAEALRALLAARPRVALRAARECDRADADAPQPVDPRDGGENGGGDLDGGVFGAIDELCLALEGARAHAAPGSELWLLASELRERLPS